MTHGHAHHPHAAASGAHHGHESHGHENHGHGSHGHGAHPNEDSSYMSEIFALEAEAFAGPLASIVADLPVAGEPRHILDLGAGTGAGTFALLERFPHAHVTAVDTSADHLSQLGKIAHERGLADRITTIEADLDAADWPDLGTAQYGAPELVWASASMHHMADPADVLRRVHELSAPDATVVLLELAGQPYFLPENVPAEAPGLELRLHEEVARLQHEIMPHLGGDWTPMLTGAGFTIAEARAIPIRIEAEDGESGEEAHTAAQITRYARRILSSMRTRTADRIDPSDLAALDHLLDEANPEGLNSRTDLTINSERELWVCRKG